MWQQSSASACEHGHASSAEPCWDRWLLLLPAQQLAGHQLLSQARHLLLLLLALCHLPCRQ
jgi:hypothetical protein